MKVAKRMRASVAQVDASGDPHRVSVDIASRLLFVRGDVGASFPVFEMLDELLMNVCKQTDGDLVEHLPARSD